MERFMSKIGLLAALTLLASTAVQAQTAPRELTLDVRPWSVDAAVAWRAGPGHLWGFAVGGGADDFNRTFRPEVADTSSA
jgi:hypothetical protein